LMVMITKETRGMRLCSLPDCDLPSRRFGWCEKHYTRYRNHGDVNYVERWPPGICIVPQCDIKRYARGYCHAHYRRLTRKGRLVNLWGEIEIDV
jgi:hypothetical protein